MTLEGVIYLVPTPLDHDENVDVASARRLVRHAIETGASGLWVLGSAGEQPFLPDHQRRVILDTCVAEANGAVPVIAGAADCSTRRTLDNLRMLREAGADYAHAVPPYYFTPTQREVIAYYTALAEAGGLPLVLYNNIAVSGVNMTPSTIAHLAALPNVVAIKESSGDLRHFQQVAYALIDNPGFSLLAGSDQLAHASLLAGGHGLVSSFASIVPQLYAGIYDSVKQGNLAAGREYQRRLVSLARVIYGCGAPIAATKYALSRLGLCPSRVCAPFESVSEEVKAQIASVLRELGVVEGEPVGALA